MQTERYAELKHSSPKVDNTAHTSPLTHSVTLADCRMLLGSQQQNARPVLHATPN